MKAKELLKIEHRKKDNIFIISDTFIEIMNKEKLESTEITTTKIIIIWFSDSLETSHFFMVLSISSVDGSIFSVATFFRRSSMKSSEKVSVKSLVHSFFKILFKSLLKFFRGLFKVYRLHFIF